MKRGELERRLRELGWYFLKDGGKHAIWAHAAKTHKIYVPRHPTINREHRARDPTRGSKVGEPMMLIGRIAKEEGPWWSAEVAALGAFTQGRSRKDAAEMLADLIETMVDRPGFKISVSFLGESGGVVIEANEPGRLIAQVLKYQREVHGLSLADVARLLGATSRNAYARYEQGHAVPSIDKMYELLRVVAPEMTLMLAERKPTKRAKSSTTSKKRRAA